MRTPAIQQSTIRTILGMKVSLGEGKICELGINEYRAINKYEVDL